MSKLYHTRLGFPTNVTLPSGEFTLKYSQHALNASWSDRYGQMTLPDIFNVDKAKLIEIEVEDDVVVKCVYRAKYDNRVDLVVVMNPQDSTVKTVWFNRTTDQHRTLQTWKYANPKK